MTTKRKDRPSRLFGLCITALSMSEPAQRMLFASPAHLNSTMLAAQVIGKAMLESAQNPDKYATKKA